MGYMLRKRGKAEGEARKEVEKGRMEGIRIKSNNLRFKIFLKKYKELRSVLYPF